MPDSEIGDKWHSWSFKVLEELTSLNLKTKQLEKEYEELKIRIKQDNVSANEDLTIKLEQTNRILQSLSEILSGAGNPEKGVIVRLDRLEQKEIEREKKQASTSKISLAALAAAISAVIGMLAKVLTGN